MKNYFLAFLKYFMGSSKKESRNAERLTTVRTEQIKYHLEKFMYQEKPFLKPRYSIKELSKDIQVPVPKLSAFINKKLDMNFSDYLNRFRIQYCQDLIQKGGMGKQSLMDLATKCGFRNRNTFASAFKKYTGKTVSEYTRHG